MRFFFAQHNLPPALGSGDAQVVAAQIHAALTDRQLTCSGLDGLVEFNWYHWIEGGDNTALPGLEGLDFYNLGTMDVDGQNIVTSAVGAKYKPHGCTEMAWPSSSRSPRNATSSTIALRPIGLFASNSAARRRPVPAT